MMVLPTVTPPPKCTNILIDFPAPHVLLAIINRPKQMNALLVEDCYELDRLWEWFDGEGEL